MAYAGFRTLLAVALAAIASGCDRGAGTPGTLHGVVEIQEVLVGSKVGGRVAETLAAEGSLLKAGDPIARFEVPEWEARRAQAEARAKAAAAELERARTGPRTEEIAAAVAASEAARARVALLRAGTRPEVIAAAKAELDAAAADLKFAEEEHARNDRLLAEKTISRNEPASTSSSPGAAGRRSTPRPRR